MRYADDFLIGVIASKAYAVDLKRKIKEFLKNDLCLRLSDEKTKITHAAENEVTFLGYIIRKGKREDHNSGTIFIKNEVVPQRKY